MTRYLTAATWHAAMTEALANVATLAANYPTSMPRNMADWAEDAGVAVVNLQDGLESALTIDDDYEGSEAQREDLWGAYGDWKREQRV